MAELPTRIAFAECQGTPFRLDAGPNGPAELELVEVTAHRPNAGPDDRPFSLLFRGPAAPVLDQRTYLLAHERLGELAIFLVPVGRDAEGVRYEAVFN